MPLSNTGFSADSVDEIVTDLNAKVLANVDPGLDLSSDQPMGQLIGIMAEKFAEIEELEATVYNAINPSAAEGVLLDNVSALSGTHRQLATFSKVTATLTLNASTTVHAGAVAYVANQPANRWVLLADVISTTAGTYSGSFRSEQAGIFKANAGTLTVIATPTPGWTAVTNAADSVDGLATDSDTSLRIKRDEELTGEGSGDIDAIRAAILKVPGVIQCFVFENFTMAIDANGVPPKAFRVVVWDGLTPLAANNVLAQAIWNQKPSGIQAYGASSGTAIDSQGTAHTMNFDRATQLRLFVTCTVSSINALSMTDITNIKGAIKAFADANFGLGVSVIARAFSASPLEPTPVYTPPVFDVPTFAFDTHASPTNTGNLSASGLQIYTLSTTDVLVNGL